MYKITRNITPNYLSDNFIRVSDVHNYSTMHMVTAIKDWNALSSITNTYNFLLYKKLVKSHLSTKAKCNEI